MIVGWLADAGNADGTLGGAELTQAEFCQAAPEGVEVVGCPPGGVVDGLDAYVVHNCVSYSPDDLNFDAPAYKYHHDTGPHISPEVWEQLSRARHICCSPLQRAKMGLIAALIPPAVDLEPFRKAAQNAGERRGAVAVGPWMNPAKCPEAVAQWAKHNNLSITFLGGGPYAPPGSAPTSYEQMPEALARFKTYVHLPRELEPCGRTALEAWAAGCEVVVNSLVGARHWIADEPEKLESAAQDFWALVTEDRSKLTAGAGRA